MSGSKDEQLSALIGPVIIFYIYLFLYESCLLFTNQVVARASLFGKLVYGV